LHVRAILGLPIPEITQERIGTSAVILGSEHCENPIYENLDIVASSSKTDFRIFGKTTSRPFRRMGVVLTHDNLDGDISEVIKKAKKLAQHVKVVSAPISKI
jgi:phosphoribosylglycinamide formyltransferase 2